MAQRLTYGGCLADNTNSNRRAIQTYSIEELISIRNLVIIQEYMKQVMEQRARQLEGDIYTQYKQGQQQQQQQHHHGSQQLTDSVAEFFKKAEQNFYSRESIDPTKVRRLSEVEAELIGGN